jgi:glycosyltransferase involved in cell wall biosynthesis
LKILILNYEYPPLGGGAGIVTQHLANEFMLKGHQVTILTTWFGGEPEFLTENNLTIIRLLSRRKHSYQSNPMEMFDWMQKAKKYAAKHFHKDQFDVCLANFTLPGGAVAHDLKKKFNLPFVILSHGHDIPWFSPNQMFFWHLLFYPFIKRVMKESYANILLTEQLKLNADKFLGEKLAAKNKIIPNGIIIFDIRQGFDAKEKILRALFVGRLVDQKDPLTVVRGFRKLQENNIPIHLKIIGDGILKEETEDFISKYQLKNIEVFGKISQSQVMEEYSKAHILIAPSREEAMSLSVLEAVSCGVYVIATEISGNKEVIINNVNGSFVEYGNPNDVSDKIIQFYNEKFLKNYQYPEELNQSIRQNYSWEITADKYLEIFKEMLK